MPPQYFPDATTAPTERSPRHSLKRPKQDISTVSPTVLALDDDASDIQTTQHGLDFVIVPATSSFRDSESVRALDKVIPGPDISHMIDNVFHTTETENFGNGSEFDTLFDQYLRSPSTSPPPVDTASEISGTTLIESDHGQSCSSTNAPQSPQDTTCHDATTCQELLPSTANLPRIRLRVHEPKITLTFKLSQQGESGRRPSNESHHQANKKEQSRHKGFQWGTQNRQRRQKGYRKRT